MNPEGLNRQPQEMHGLLSHIALAEQRWGGELVVPVLASLIYATAAGGVVVAKLRPTEAAPACDVATACDPTPSDLLAFEGVVPLFPTKEQPAKQETPLPQSPAAMLPSVAKPSTRRSLITPKKASSGSASSPAQPHVIARHGHGYDVSYPQCPYIKQLQQIDPGDVAIVGVNGGRPDNTNSCLPALLEWAKKAVDIELYFNTANADKGGTPDWPTSNIDIEGKPIDNPYGACHGEGSPACAYDDGYNTAIKDDTQRFQPAAASVHLPTDLSKYKEVGLDVETANKWSVSQPNNRAVLEGMVAYFRKKGARIDLYSIDAMFVPKIGQIPSMSNLVGLDSWKVQIYKRDSLEDLCKTELPLTPGGHVTMMQDTMTGPIDIDLVC